MIIDLEHHIHLNALLGERGSASGRVKRYWAKDGQLKYEVHPYSIEDHVRFLDEAGIDMAVLSRSPVSLEYDIKWHDACARAVRERPTRLQAFACGQPLGGKPALDELERAVKSLGMKGIHIITRPGGLFLDSRELWPFYEKVSELGVPIDVHVTGYPPGFDALNAPYALYYTMAREFDLCAATFRLCLGGVLEEFPDLVFIINHFGGGISATMERVDLYSSVCGVEGTSFYKDEKLINKPWRHYFDQLYFSMAGRQVGMAAVRCALTTISPRKLMLGTDWPMNYESDPQEARRYIEEIGKLDLPAADIAAILGGTASSLLGI